MGDIQTIKKIIEGKSIFFSLLTIFLFIVFLIQSFQIYSLHKKVALLGNEVASTSATLSLTTSELFQNVKGLSTTLTNTEETISAVKNQVGGVEQVVGSISGTVGTLKKLAEVDPEVLKKYSKVYFLSENYVPLHLVAVPTQYLYDSNRQEQYVSEALPHLVNMLETAKAQNIPIYIKSGYRSFGEQKSLKSAYTVLYGAGTSNTFSADQGYSEHQLGTTVDFITTGMNGQLSGFDKTVAYEWLTKNAHNFGFVLSYPKGNKYYIYEPWHWRFVGIELATYLYQNKLNFYDVDQRVIDKYLAKTFE
jgi:LAS superfamily LD-carboxypeptidase LdcB